MRSTLSQRVERLEQQAPAELKVRYVWWRRESEPRPVAQPGEKLVIISWLPSTCLLYTSPSPRDLSTSRIPSSA